MRFLVVLAVASLAMTAVGANEKKIVCYLGSWATYRPGAGKFEVENIDPRLCTHLIYSFVGVSGNSIKILDPWQDLPDAGGKNGIGRFNALRKLSPNTKTLVAVGGWNVGSEQFSKMASSPSSRSAFVKNAIEFVKKHRFNGLDVDWEYPGQREGSSHADVKNYVALLRELRSAFDREGLLLSVAVAATKMSASQSYIIPEVSKYAHFVNLMTYDLHGDWDRRTGMNAPLYPAASETGSARELNVDACVKYWLSQGVDRSKLVLGIATYGRTFTLSNPAVNGVGVAAGGPGAAGPYTRQAGFLGYNEICEKNDWSVVFDKEQRTPYAHCGNQWVGYDNVKSVMEKAEYAKKMGLGGAMVWSIETDDFGGRCGESYPLLKTLNHVLRGGAAVSDVPPRAPDSGSKPFDPKADGNQGGHPNPAGGNPNPAPGTDTSGECHVAGDIPDPSNCEHFFKCVATTDNKYVKWVMDCPAGLCFKAETGVCDWK